MRPELSIEQKAAVNSTSRYCTVLAGAGSGKTLVLTRRIERLVGSANRGEKVLAITFSNKAADEVEQRLLETYSPSELRKKVFVGTIHNFCLALVVRRGTSIGLPPNLHVFEDYNDRLAVFSEAINAVPQARAHLAEMSDETTSRNIRVLFDEMGIAERDPIKRQQFLAQPTNRMVYDEYHARLLAQHAIDFDGILAYAIRILSEQPATARLYQRVYRNICVDEAQDLNYAQYNVIRVLAGDGCGITMVGDPTQAIYGFNGSSSSILTKLFPQDYPSVKVFQLKDNYRSSAAVMRAAHRIEPSFEMRQNYPILGEVTCRSFPCEIDEARWVTQSITKLTTKGHPDDEVPIPLERCAILARNRYLLGAMPPILESAGISYQERYAAADSGQEESDLFRYFHLGLRLIVNPNDRLHLEQLNQGIFGSSHSTSFDQVLGFVGAYDGLTEKESDALRDAWGFLEAANQFRFDNALARLEELCEDPDAFWGEEDCLLVSEDLVAWRERWESYCHVTIQSERSLPGFLRAVALGSASARERIEGVTLSTVHMAKGLEFDAVFVVGLNEGSFPDYRADTPDKLAEERNSMFVAITRSRRYCYLTRPEVRSTRWGDRKQRESRFFTSIKTSI